MSVMSDRSLLMLDIQTRLQCWARLCLFGLLCCIGTAALAADTEGSRFIRFVDGDQTRSGELQTAIVSYVNDQGIQLDLVAAVHLADAEYYNQLNRYFSERDRVLYELVAEPDARPVPGQALPLSPIGFIQQAMAGFLEVEFQLQRIHYGASNFRHADLSPTQLAAALAVRDQGMMGMFLSLAAAQLASEREALASGQAQPSAFTYLSLLEALNAEDRGAAFKYLMARELGRSGGIVIDPQLEAELTILGDRNAAALAVLQQEIDAGDARSISLFYGAAHMPGLERELLQSLGFRRERLRWLSAWQIP